MTRAMTLIAFSLIIFNVLPIPSALAVEQRETLPSPALFQDGFFSEDLTPAEILLLRANDLEFKALNDSWGWPAWDHQGKYEDQLHKKGPVYGALTPYTDILFRFLANKFDRNGTFLRYDFPTLIGRVLSSPIHQEVRGELSGFLNGYLNVGTNRALLKKIANLTITKDNSLFFIIAILSARSIFYLSESKFNEAFEVISRADALWTMNEQQEASDGEDEEATNPKKRKPSSSSDDE